MTIVQKPRAFVQFLFSLWKMNSEKWTKTKKKKLKTIIIQTLWDSVPETIGAWNKMNQQIVEMNKTCFLCKTWIDSRVLGSGSDEGSSISLKLIDMLISACIVITSQCNFWNTQIKDRWLGTIVLSQYTLASPYPSQLCSMAGGLAWACILRKD